MARRLITIAALSCLVATSPAFAGGAKAPVPHLQPLRLYLDWFPNIEFAGIYAAMEKGWYRDAGIDLQLVFEGLDIIPSVLKGKADIGMHSAHDLIRSIADGSPIKAFAAQYQLNPNCIAARKDSGIESMKDLRGKTVGIWAPQDRDIYRVMLGSAGLTLDDVHVKEVHTFKETEIIDLMKSHELDALIAWEFNWTVTFSLLNYPVRVFPGYDNGFHFYGTVFFAKNDYIAANRGTLHKFLDATFRGWREVYKDPERYAREIVEQRYPPGRYINGSKELTLRQQIAELRLRKRYFVEGVGEENMGKMSRAQWAEGLSTAKKYGLIPADSKTKVEDLYDGSVWDLPRALAAVPDRRPQ